VARTPAALAGSICLGGLAFGALEAWPLWATGSAVVVPWIPVFAHEVAWVYRRYGRLALFYVLVVGQGGHFPGFPTGVVLLLAREESWRATEFVEAEPQPASTSGAPDRA